MPGDDPEARRPGGLPGQRRPQSLCQSGYGEVEVRSAGGTWCCDGHGGEGAEHGGGRRGGPGDTAQPPGYAGRTPGAVGDSASGLYNFL